MSTINLLPEDYLQRRAQQRANVLCLILFGIVMAGVIGAAVVTEEQASKTRIVRDKVDSQYDDASRMIAQLEQLEAKKKQVLQKAEIASDLRERVPRSDLLACVTNSLPKGTGLLVVNLVTTKERQRIVARVTKFSRDSRIHKNVAPVKTKPAPLDVKLEVTGMAQNDSQVAQFIRNLSKNDIFESVDLAYSEQTTYEKIGIREFKVIATLKPNADVDAQPIEPGSGKNGAKLSNAKA